jgi:Mg-chelatase subunit ChlD
MNPDSPLTPRQGLEMRVTALLLGELPADKADALRAQIAADPELAALHARLQQAIALLKEARSIPAEPAEAAPARLSPERREKLFAHFKTTPVPVRPSHRDWKWVAPLGLAATLVLLIGGSLLGLKHDAPFESSSDFSAPSGVVIADARSVEKPVALAFESRLPQSDASRTHFSAPSMAAKAQASRTTPFPNQLADTRRPAAPAEAISTTSSAKPSSRFTEGWSMDGTASTSRPVNRSDYSQFADSVADNATITTPADVVALQGRASAVGSNPAGANTYTGATTVRDSTPSTVGTTGAVFFAPAIPQTPAINLGSGLSIGATVPQTGFFDSVDEFNFSASTQPSLVKSGSGTLSLQGQIAPQAADAPAAAGEIGRSPMTEGRLVLPKESGGFTGEIRLSPPTNETSGYYDQTTGPKFRGKVEEVKKSHNFGLDTQTSAGRTGLATGGSAGSNEAQRFPAAESTSRELARRNNYQARSLEALEAGQKALAAGDTETAAAQFKLARDLGSAAPSVRENAPLDGLSRADDKAGEPKKAEPIRRNPSLSANAMPSVKVIPSAPDGAETPKEGRTAGNASKTEAAVTEAWKQSADAASNEKRGRMLWKVDGAWQSPVRKFDPPASRPVSPAPEPQPEIATSANPFSTFSLNVTDVSFKLAAASLEKGKMPDVATVRSEEFINAFDYHDPEPAPGTPLTCTTERAQYPFAQNRDLLRCSVKTASAGRAPGRPLNVVLLLDNSGSMERADRVRIVQEALRVLAAQLQPQDKLSIVTFARTPHLWIDGVAGDKAAAAVARVSEITPEGGTNLQAALYLGYTTARQHFQEGSINRVVLLTDGAANLGDVNPDTLQQQVEAERRRGIALDAFGIGWEGYDDSMLETLSRHGDGRYGFINTPEAAATEFAGQLAGALHVAASDVKVQVEFNPRRVTAYRQIGYAKHQLTKEQFRDNTVDAAELGAAESGNALYVVEVDPHGEGDLATVRVRFKVPGTSDYREHAWPVPFNGPAQPLDHASPALRLAGTASAFSEMLAGSQFATEVTSDALLRLINGVPRDFGADPRPQKLEWMIRQAKSLSGH